MYDDFSRETFDMVLAEAEKFSTEVLFPTLAEGDRAGCKLENGEVLSDERCKESHREDGGKEK